MFAVALLVGLGPPLYRRWRRKVSITWPLTTAKFLGGRIEKEYAPEGEGPIYTLYAQYSYIVESGSPFVGEYEQRIAGESEGEQLLRSFKNGPLYVRYNPSRIDNSVLAPYRDVRPDPSSIK